MRLEGMITFGLGRMLLVGKTFIEFLITNISLGKRLASGTTLRFNKCHNRAR
jgi:hypothetical protein